MSVQRAGDSIAQLVFAFADALLRSAFHDFSSPGAHRGHTATDDARLATARAKLGSDAILVEHAWRLGGWSLLVTLPSAAGSALANAWKLKKTLGLVRVDSFILWATFVVLWTLYGLGSFVRLTREWNFDACRIVETSRDERCWGARGVMCPMARAGDMIHNPL